MKPGLYLFLIFYLVWMPCCQDGIIAQPADKLQITRPAQGAIIPDNTPTFTWSHVECEGYTIWIDGIRMDSVPASQNWYLPFPMSYGPHLWTVVAHRGQHSIKSSSGDFTIADAPLTRLPEGSILLREDWEVASSLLVGRDGASLSGITGVTGPWKSTSVPATVLSVQVRNGLYPNPYIGLNNMKIPDCSDEFNREYDLLKYSHIPGKNPWKDPYWYRSEFQIPESYQGKKIWLTLGEINYRAEVWLNGTEIADTSQVIGMERRFRFEITNQIDPRGTNTLAIAIYPPDHPGKPAPPPLAPLADPGTNMADGLLSKDYTRWDVLGWDWIPAVRDRDMGITEDIYIHATGSIELDNLYVTSDLPLPDTSSAKLVISGDLINWSGSVTEGTIQGTVTATGQNIRIEQPFRTEPGDTLHFYWDSENFPQLNLKDPRLWWPNGYGSPELYKLSLVAETGTGDRSRKEMKFGIREVETSIGSNERVYKINGRDIYCKGGNWVLDMTLNWTASRYMHEISLTRNSNLNMLRIWGPTGAPPEVFYEAADENGIMLWQDFLNDFWGTFRNRPGYCPKESLFEEATISIIKKYRNHPALVIWGSGNEGPNPREELIIHKILPLYDGRDSKHYLKISNGDGLHGGGPYHTIEPKAYFTDPKLTGFSSEIGPSGVPVAESVLKFMPDLGSSWMPGRFPLDGVWAYHDANDWPGRDRRKFSSYDNIIRNYYGATDSTSKGAERYLDQCQLLNYDVYRASIDAISCQLWKNSSGILLWKSNSAWPSMTWQIYDWYLQAHAGYYGVKKAAAPVTVFFNRGTYRVEALNAAFHLRDSVTVSAVLFNSNCEKIWESSEILSLGENSVSPMKDSVPLKNELCFLKLKISDQNGHPIADNFYWLHEDHDFSSLADLPEPALGISSLNRLSADEFSYSITIVNRGKSVALMTQLKLTDSNTGLEILPTIWSDNFISLLPGEETVVSFTTCNQNLPEKVLLNYKSYQMKSWGQYALDPGNNE